VGERILTCEPGSYEGRDLATREVVFTVTLKGDTFEVPSVGDDVHFITDRPDEPSGLSSFLSKGGNYTPEVRVLSPTRIVITMGPYPGYSSPLREHVTLKFDPPAFSSKKTGWDWNVEGKFEIKKHVQKLAGAEQVEDIVGSPASLATMGSPTAAGKLALIAELTNCPSDEEPGADMDMGFSESPFGIEISGSHVKLNLGATIINSLVLFPAIALVHFLICMLFKFISGKTIYESMATMLFPCWLSLPGLLIFQGTLEAALKVVYYGEPLHALAVVPILGGTIAFPVWVVRRTVQRLKTGEAHPQMCGPNSNRCRRYFVGEVEYTSMRDTTWVDRWGMLFWDFRPGHEWGMQVDLASIVLLSLLGAWKPRIMWQCMVQTGLISLIFLALAAWALIRKPFQAECDHHFWVLINGLEGVAVLCVFVVLARGEDKVAEEIGGICLIIVTYATIVKTIIDLLIFFYELWEVKCGNKKPTGDPLLFVSMPSEGRGTQILTGQNSTSVKTAKHESSEYSNEAWTQSYQEIPRVRSQRSSDRLDEVYPTLPARMRCLSADAITPRQASLRSMHDTTRPTRRGSRESQPNQERSRSPRPGRSPDFGEETMPVLQATPLPATPRRSINSSQGWAAASPNHSIGGGDVRGRPAGIETMGRIRVIKHLDPSSPVSPAGTPPASFRGRDLGRLQRVSNSSKAGRVSRSPNPRALGSTPRAGPKSPLEPHKNTTLWM